MTRCGTYGGAQRHQRRGEDPCEPCREARNEYVAGRRADPYARQRERRLHRDCQRALSRLAREYPRRYLELLDEVRGLPAPEPPHAPSAPPTLRRLPGGVVPAEIITAEVSDAERQAS